LLNDSNLELTDLGKYINQMGQDGAWAGHPEIYAAAWCYKVGITIYSKDYTALGGSLVFKSAGMTDEFASDWAMIYLSYHNNNHFNSVRPPIFNQSNGPVYLNGAEQLEVDIERAINDHQDEFGQAIAIYHRERSHDSKRKDQSYQREFSEDYVVYCSSTIRNRWTMHL
jgi:hypothetical protein